VVLLLLILSRLPLIIVVAAAVVMKNEYCCCCQRILPMVGSDFCRINTKHHLEILSFLLHYLLQVYIFGGAPPANKNPVVELVVSYGRRPTYDLRPEDKSVIGWSRFWRELLELPEMRATATPMIDTVLAII
jgi:hypothetical protein